MLSGIAARRGFTFVVALAATVGQGAAALGQTACSSSRTNLFQNPFNKDSAHHRPIGRGAVYASDSHPATRDWLRATKLNINVGVPFGTDLVETDTGDPIRTIGARAHCDNVVGLPISIRFPRTGYVTEVEHNHNGCPDGDVIFYDRVTGTPHHLRQYNWNGGRPTAGQHRTFNIRGLGHGTRPGERLGMAATGVAGMFGVARGHEFNQPGRKIEHALRMGLPRKPGCRIMLSRNFVLPATSGDRNRTSAGYNTGNIPYGGLMALPPSVNIDSLGLSEPGRRLAEALQNYGIYAVDGGGCSAGAMETDQTLSDGVRSQMVRDMPKIYRHMRLVLNNDVLGNPVAGGGTPLARNCAFDAS